MTRKKPAKAKKSSKKKTSKIIVDDAEPSGLKMRILAQINITPEVEEILKSNEAKLYLTGIDRAYGKLQVMIDRELRLYHHPARPGAS